MELEKRVKDLEEVMRISALLTDETRSLSFRMQQTLNALLKVIGARTGSIMLVENNELVVHAASNSRILGFRRSLKDPSVSTEVVQTGEIAQKCWLGKQKPQPAISQYKSDFSVSLPLFASGRIIGVLNITDKLDATSSDFNQQELEFVQNFKKWIEIILDNARMKRKIEENLRKTALDLDHPMN